MAFYLAFDGVDDNVTFTPLNNTSSTFEIELDWAPTSLAFNFGIVFGNNSPDTNTRHAVFTRTTGELEVAWIIGGTRRLINTSGAGLVVGTRKTLKIVYDGATLTALIDDAPVGSVAATGTPSGTNGISAIGKNDVQIGNLDLYRFRATFDSVLENDYDPSASGGTGLVLEDVVGANNGTLIGYDPPNDDSQWVFYDAGGATFTLLFDAGSYAYTGNTFDLTASRNVSLEAGLYTYTGQDLDLSFGRNITLDAGGYVYTGQDLDLAAGRNVSLDAGNYSYNGQDLTVKADRNLSFDAGSYAYTGQDLTLLYTPVGGPTYLISLDAGSYQVTGNDITLAANRAILLDAGGYSYTGQTVVLAANRKLSLDAGSYAVTGEDSTLIASRNISLDTGVYSYTGIPITLDYSGEIISLISQYSVNYANDVVSATYSNQFITARFL